MSTTLRWGLLSTARINRRLIGPIRAAGRSEIVAVASRSTETAAAFAEEWDIPQTFSSYEAMLASDEIDAVYIPLPNSLHREWTVKAAEAGKHILCEKPMATTMDEVDAMITAAETNKVVLQEQFQYHMHPQQQTLRQVIREGRIGKVQLVRARFSFSLAEGSGNIRLDKTLGGGSLWDVGSYAASFVLSVVDSSAVAVQGWQQVNDSGADVVFAGQIRFANGAVGQIDSGFRMPYRIGAEVTGETGVIYVDNPWQPDLDGRSSGLRLVEADGTEHHIANEKLDPYLGSVRSFEAAVLDGTPPQFSLAETRAHMAVLTSLYRSAETGQVVSLG